jgi:hypothetical protein
MKRNPNLIVTALLCLGLCALSAPAQEPAVPQWFADHIAFMTQKSGRWITDNSAHKSKNEPFDAYGTEWKKGLGGKSMKGRLFGLRDDKEAGTFWEFLVYWHPGDKEVRVLQLGGNGVVGAGTMTSPEKGKTSLEQEFFNPDGSSIRVGHESEEGGDGVNVTRSINITADGTRQVQRTYTWRVQP